MSREDIEMHGASVWSPEEFDLSFYQNDVNPVALSAVDKLVNDLTQAVENVPGVVVSDAE